MRRALTSCLLGITLLAGCAHQSFTPTRQAGFIQESAGGDSYYVYVPKDWSPEAADRKWPVIVYLHGGMERGSDGVKQTQTGLGPVVWRSQGSFPFIVIFPQAAHKTYWGMPDNNARVLKMLDDVLAKYHGDPDRVYLTGNSLGGFGTWFLGALHPERFAALVPICGGVRGKAPSPDAPFAKISNDERPREVARRLGKMPIWIFHGKSDWLVPVASSREMAKVMKENGGDVRFTEYPGVGHQSWVRAYDDPELWKWLAAQHKEAGKAP